MTINSIDHYRLDVRLLDGVLSEAEIWSLLRSLLSQLQHIHQAGDVVANLQPEMITQGSEERFELFLSSLPLNPEYVAPEQLHSKPIAASDIYSLGLICIHSLTGISPFALWDTTTSQWCWEPYLQEDISPQLRSLLEKMVKREISDRYPSVAAILTELGWRDLIPPTRNNTAWQCIQTLNGHRQAVTDLACNWSSQKLYSSSEDKSIGLWDLHTGRLVEKLLHHGRSVTSLALHPSGQLLAAASDDKTMSIWDLTSNTLFQLLEGHSQAVKSIQFTPDGDTLVSASWDKSIRFWNWHSGKQLRSLTGHRLKIADIDLSPDGRWLASGSHDRTVRIWDVATAQTSHILEGHQWSVTAVAFSPNGQLIATGSDDKSIKIWETATGNLCQTLPGHAWDIGCLRWIDNNHLISGSWNPAIKIWDWRSGEAQTVKAHDDFVTSILFHGETIITSSGDRSIKQWQTLVHTP